MVIFVKEANPLPLYGTGKLHLNRSTEIENNIEPRSIPEYPSMYYSRITVGVIKRHAAPRKPDTTKRLQEKMPITWGPLQAVVASWDISKLTTKVQFTKWRFCYKSYRTQKHRRELQTYKAKTKGYFCLALCLTSIFPHSKQDNWGEPAISHQVYRKRPYGYSLYEHSIPLVCWQSECRDPTGGLFGPPKRQIIAAVSSRDFSSKSLLFGRLSASGFVAWCC